MTPVAGAPQVSKQKDKAVASTKCSSSSATYESVCSILSSQ